MMQSLNAKSSFGGMVLTIGVITVFLGLSNAAVSQPIRPEAIRAAECMVDVLKAMPGNVEAHVDAGPGYETPQVVYSVRAPTGQIFHREVAVYEDGPARFSINMSEGVTRPLFEAWHRCGVTTILDSHR